MEQAKARQAFEFSQALHKLANLAAEEQMHFDNHYDGRSSAGHGPECPIHLCDSYDGKEWGRANAAKHELKWDILEMAGFTVYECAAGRVLVEREEFGIPSAAVEA